MLPTNEIAKRDWNWKAMAGERPESREIERHNQEEKRFAGGMRLFREGKTEEDNCAMRNWREN